MFEPVIIAAAIGFLGTAAGTFVGAYLSFRIMKRQEKIRLLAEFYAEVFSTYTAAIPFSDHFRNMAFIAAADKAKLFCSKESYEILTIMQDKIVAGEHNNPKFAELLAALRTSAKKDLTK